MILQKKVQHFVRIQGSRMSRDITSLTEIIVLDWFETSNQSFMSSFHWLSPLQNTFTLKILVYSSKLIFQASKLRGSFLSPEKKTKKNPNYYRFDRCCWEAGRKKKPNLFCPHFYSCEMAIIINIRHKNGPAWLARRHCWTLHLHDYITMFFGEMAKNNATGTL